MRIDYNYMKFSKYDEYYTHEDGQLYIPTDDCPEDIRKAILKYDSYAFPEQYKEWKESNMRKK